MQRNTFKRSFLTVIAVIVMVGAITVFLTLFQKKMMGLLTEMSLQNISEMQELYAEALRNKFKDQFKTLEAQAAYFYDSDITDTDALRKKATFALEIGDFKKVAVVSEDGVSVDLSGKILPNMKNKEYFTNAITKNQIQFAELIELDEQLNPCLVITYPFKTKDNQNGVIAGYLSYDTLLNIFSIPIFSGKSYFYLITADGNIILLNKEKDKNLYNINIYDYIKKSSGYENPNLAKLKLDIIKNTTGNITLDGTEGKKLYSYTPLKINNWYLISTLPYSYIYEQQKKINILVYILLIATGIAIVIFICIVYLIIKKSLAIQKDNERLTIANNQAQTLIFEYDKIKQTVDFSGDTHFILGSNKKNFSINYIRTQCFTRIHPEDANIMEHLRNCLATNNKNFSAEFRYKDYSDNYLWVKMTGSSIFNNEGELINFIGSITNVNSQILHEQELRNIADRDRLSYLLNKNAMERNIKQYLSSNGQNKYSALIIVDLDNFKDVNDNLGHMTGDLAIKDAAKKLSLIFSDKDYLGRFGGDEFCILMCFSESLTKENILKIINVKANDLVRSLKEEYINENQKVNVTASIGISIYPDHGKNYEELFQKADQALYNVKQHGKDGFKIFE